MIYKEWIDFVSYPLDPNKITSREQRLDLADAVVPTSPHYKIENGAIITKEFIHLEYDNDEFEAMAISDYGDVCIWTKKKVWFLLRRGEMMEKMMFVQRHPDSVEV